MFGDARRQGARHHARQFLDAGLAQLRDAAEMAQELLRGARADAGDFVEFARKSALRAALAVKGHGEAVRFVADLLDQVQQRRMFFEADRLVFLSEDE